MIKFFEKHPVFTIVIVVLLMLLPSLESLQVTIMEARNFITAREMITDGNWILTTMNGEARYEKPPLPTWITAIFGLLFGVKNIFFLRLPAVFMVCVVGVSMYYISNQLFENKFFSFISGLIVVTSFYVFGIIIEAPWDIYAHGFMLISILFIIKAHKSDAIHYNIIAILFLACSVMCKGPISLYALFLPFLISYTIVFKINKGTIYKILLVLVIGALIGAMWFYYVRFADADAFLKIVSKESSNWSSYNVKPIYYYWSFFVQSGIWTIPAFIGLLFPYMKNRASNKKVYKFTFYWTILSVVLLSLIPEKKSRYLMPVLIPLAMNTAFYIEYLIVNFKTLKNKKETLPMYFNFGLLGLIGVAFPLIGYFIYNNNAASIEWQFILSAVCLFIVGCLIFRNLFKKQLRSVFYLVITLLILVFGSFSSIKDHLLKKNMEFNNINSLKIGSLGNGINMYVFDYITPEMLWDYGDKVTVIKSNNGIYELPAEKKFGLLVNNMDVFESQNYDEDYQVHFQELFDLNMPDSKDRKHKNRLTINYFILSRK